MNLWTLHYSFINHHFHHSTITIKQKIIINKLVTELLLGHFLWKNSCSNEKRQIPRTSAGKKTNSAVNSAAQIPRKKPKFRGLARNSAARRKTVGPTHNYCSQITSLGKTTSTHSLQNCISYMPVKPLNPFTFASYSSSNHRVYSFIIFLYLSLQFRPLWNSAVASKSMLHQQM